GPIEVTQLNLGEEYPMFNNARIRPSEQPGRMRVEVDCVFTDQITLGIDTHIFINWPKPKIAVLPISMVVSVVKFSATMTLEIVNTHQSTSIATSALPDFALCFDVQSLIGSCSKLESVPKVTHILTSKLRNLF
ncbi:10168_t:CDS:2, partial [Paraglomus occultum]